MRQRIRDVAASRGLSETDIKPALTLKHREIGNFGQTYGVNLAWLLEGGGPMFLKEPDVDRSTVLSIVRDVIAERDL
jgi:hypothetical protein